MAGSFLGGLTSGSVGSAVVKLFLDDSQYTAGLNTAKAQTQASTAAMSTSMSKFNLATQAAFAGAVAGVGALTIAAVSAAIEQERVLTQLRSVVGENTQAYEEQALALQRMTGASDEAILSADAILARFKLTGEEVRAAVPLVLDYAQAVGKDVPTAASAVGKALLGNSRALKEIGIEYTRTGNRSRDFADILTLLQEKVGGTAKAFGETTAGQLQIAREEFDELLETVGAELLPVLNELVPAVTEAVRAITPLLSTSVAESAEAITGWVMILTDAVDVLEDLANAAGLGAEEFGGVWRTISELNPAGPILTLGRAYRDWRGEQEESIYMQERWLRSLMETKRTNIETFLLDAADAAGILADDTDEAADASDRHAKAIQRQVERLYDLKSVQLELAGGVLGLIESARTYTEAQDDVNRLQQEGQRGTAEYRDAIADLLSQRLELEQQFLDFGKVLADEIDAETDAREALASARGALKEYGIAAGLTGEQMREFISAGLAPVREEVRRLTEGLEDLPDVVDIKIAFGVDARELQNLESKLSGLAASYGFEFVTGRATGGIIGAARGMVVRKPTFLVGEGSYSTFAGKGAEAVIPLNERGIDILAEAVRRGQSGAQGVTLHFHGDVYADEDFGDKVMDAIASYRDGSVLI